MGVPKSLPLAREHIGGSRDSKTESVSSVPKRYLRPMNLNSKALSRNSRQRLESTLADSENELCPNLESGAPATQQKGQKLPVELKTLVIDSSIRGNRKGQT